jgi:hypothetical protein
MPNYRLADGVSYGLVDGEPIFLDLEADLYFTVDPPLLEDLDRLRRSDGTLPEREARRLLDSGLVREAGRCEPIGPAPAFIPDNSLFDRPAMRASGKELAEVAFLLTRARLSIRWTGLAGMAGATLPSTEPAEQDRLRAMASRFEAARRLIPLDRHCLTDSLALLQFLGRRSLSASLLFGVKRHPFAAHCWMQDDQMVLNDDAETVRGFTPVLVL